MRSRAPVCALVALSALLLAACGSSGGDAPSTRAVQIQGEVTLLVGTSVQLKAITIDGSDTAYDWETSDGGCAAVDGTGLVTGVAPGTATIRATGLDTGRGDEVEVVVSAWEAVDWSDMPFYPEWRQSAHGDESAEAFHHWDADGEIPTSCARCHSTSGFRDFLGDDGSAAGTVDSPAPIGSTIGCTACHNAVAPGLTSVTFASGDVVSDLDIQALCMQCHQTRGSTPGVDAAIADAFVATDDTVSSSLGFSNPHYLGSGATRYGTLARGGYQYEGKSYDARFSHVSDQVTCLDCHDPHSLHVDPAGCAVCHADVTSIEDARDIRMMSSISPDYDGDGNRGEGVYDEIQGLAARLYETLQVYADDVVGQPIALEQGVYPYFFHDTNDNGVADPDEAVYANQYGTWTARLVRAAYNLQFAKKDPGAFVHNAKYVLQLLHDSILDLNGALPVPLDLSALDRDDPGHFDGSADAARHWDDDGSVPSSCTPCHGESRGFLAALGFTPPAGDVPPPNALDCATCHTEFVDFGLVSVATVTFPGGQTVTFGVDTPSFEQDEVSLLCALCHAGREAKATIDLAIAANDLKFLNVHYLPAAGVLFGSQTQVGYEYPGMIYSGRWIHAEMGFGNYTICHGNVHGSFGVPDPVDWWDHSSGPDGSQCVVCHDPRATDHTFRASDSLESCENCHGDLDSPRGIRENSIGDYDGDGDATEPLADEIATLAADLLAQIQAVATSNGSPIAYDLHAYPYFFNDTNGNGVVDGAEGAYGNAYTAWTADLMKAAHNYQISRKDPAAWAHNFAYTTQLLIDAIADLGGDVSGYLRPS